MTIKMRIPQYNCQEFKSMIATTWFKSSDPKITTFDRDYMWEYIKFTTEFDEDMQFVIHYAQKFGGVFDSSPFATDIRFVGFSDENPDEDFGEEFGFSITAAIL